MRFYEADGGFLVDQVQLVFPPPDTFAKRYPFLKGKT